MNTELEKKLMKENKDLKDRLGLAQQEIKDYGLSYDDAEEMFETAEELAEWEAKINKIMGD